MFVPIILGSDKTTVSVATGHTEYWPVYLSIGNIHNSARRAHKNGLVLLGFLAIPKSMFSPSIFVILCTNFELYQRKKNIRTMCHIENFVGNFCTPHSRRFWTLSNLVWRHPKLRDALMVTIAMSFMASVLISPTTLNKLFCRALYKGGARSMSPFSWSSHCLTHLSDVRRLRIISTKRRVSYVDVRNIRKYWSMSLN